MVVYYCAHIVVEKVINTEASFFKVLTDIKQQKSSKNMSSVMDNKQVYLGFTHKIKLFLIKLDVVPRFLVQQLSGSVRFLL